MFKEKVVKYYSGEFDLNCAESMIYGANEEYDLNLNQKALDTMSSFGGGMGVESVCGALTGGLAVLGVLFTYNKSLDSEIRKAIVTDFYNAFEKRFGTDNCKKIKANFRDETVGCQNVVKWTAEVLEQVIKKYQTGKD